MRRLLFVSSGSFGAELLAWLREQECQIVHADTENTRIAVYPDYDLGISFLYTHRIPASEFDVGRTWVNFHPGPLPEYRGRNLAYHAILEGATRFGATIHYMDRDFDTGQIIEVVRFPILQHDTSGDLVARSHALLVELFKKYIPRLLAGEVPGYPQPTGRYYRRSEIDEELQLTEAQKLRIRALTVHPKHHACARIGGRVYRIVPEKT